MRDELGSFTGFGPPAFEPCARDRMHSAGVLAQVEDVRVRCPHKRRRAPAAPCRCGIECQAFPLSSSRTPRRDEPGRKAHSTRISPFIRAPGVRRSNLLAKYVAADRKAAARSLSIGAYQHQRQNGVTFGLFENTDDAATATSGIRRNLRLFKLVKAIPCNYATSAIS